VAGLGHRATLDKFVLRLSNTIVGLPIAYLCGGVKITVKFGFCLISC
jgi:hypothetical protein